MKRPPKYRKGKALTIQEVAPWTIEAYQREEPAPQKIEPVAEFEEDGKPIKRYPPGPEQGVVPRYTAKPKGGKRKPE